MKKIAMIPARLGSKRVPNKNLRMIDGKPLVCYVLDTLIKSKAFSKKDIYINSESLIFKTIADSRGVNFYHRSERLSSDEATNDEFALDFIEATKCDVLYQFLATSPFLSCEDINLFVKRMESELLDTLVSVKSEQIECVHLDKPINFNQKKKSPPSQDLEPIYAYACGMMAWNSQKFISNMKKYDSGYHGGDGKIGYYALKGYSTVDVDTNEDFQLAEAIHSSLSLKKKPEPTYYVPEKHAFIRHEVHVPEILDKDGVQERDFVSENKTIVNAREIIENASESSWIRRIVNTENNSCCLISQLPGEGNRKHYHPSWNEWWYIVDGEWDFEIESKIHRVKKDDIIFIPKNSWHKITAVGDKPAVRLAVSREDVKHSYDTSEEN